MRRIHLSDLILIIAPDIQNLGEFYAKSGPFYIVSIAGTTANDSN
jgi:hypothetical protein